MNNGESVHIGQRFLGNCRDAGDALQSELVQHRARVGGRYRKGQGHHLPFRRDEMDLIPAVHIENDTDDKVDKLLSHSETA